MKKFWTGLCASALAISFVATPVVAAPMIVPKAERAEAGVVPVQYEPWREMRRDMRRDARREARRDFRCDMRRMERRGDWYYYNGYRGYRQYRPGYREVNGWWFPAAAFLAGALVTGAIQADRAPRSGNAHVEWCYNRYRSYRATDNTFQPYNGPRQQCISPYY